MAARQRIRMAQILREVEGYLELALPERALKALDRLPKAASSSSRALYLRGEALRELQRYADAIRPLAQAAELDPEDIHIQLALGWCYKRVGKLELAIDALETALKEQPEEALLWYNLACYWSLAEDKPRALMCLSEALDRDARYRDLIGAERDFDPIRSDPDFQAMIAIIV